MKYKAAIFDIDGTLVPRGQKGPSQATQQALAALQAQGVKVIIATGRPLYAAKPILGGLRPDAYVAANGAYIENGKGNELFRQSLTAEEMYALVDHCEDHELPLAFLFSDAYYVYVEYEAYRERLPVVRPWLQDGEDQVRHLQDMPFAACACMSQQQAAAFTAKYGHLGLRLVDFGSTFGVNWWDVLRADTSKAGGLSHLLARWGIDWAETVAFGDGNNDAEMLSAAGLAVRMDGGAPVLEAVTDVVAPPADQDGVARLVRRLLAGEDVHVL